MIDLNDVNPLLQNLEKLSKRNTLAAFLLEELQQDVLVFLERIQQKILEVGDLEVAITNTTT